MVEAEVAIVPPYEGFCPCDRSNVVWSHSWQRQVERYPVVGEDGITALQVPPGDSDALTQKIDGRYNKQIFGQRSAQLAESEDTDRKSPERTWNITEHC